MNTVWALTDYRFISPSSFLSTLSSAIAIFRVSNDCGILERIETHRINDKTKASTKMDHEKYKKESQSKTLPHNFRFMFHIFADEEKFLQEDLKTVKLLTFPPLLIVLY